MVQADSLQERSPSPCTPIFRKEDEMDLTRNHEYFPSLDDTVDVGKAIVNLQRVWDQFLVTGVVPQGDLRPMIVTSWKRCLNFKVNPHNHIANNLSQEELDLKIKSREEYQEVIWQFIYLFYSLKP